MDVLHALASLFGGQHPTTPQPRAEQAQAPTTLQPMQERHALPEPAAHSQAQSNQTQEPQQAPSPINPLVALHALLQDSQQRQQGGNSQLMGMQPNSQQPQQFQMQPMRQMLPMPQMAQPQVQ